ncbi:hypothetical protein FSP39_002118 [Pinctada imbricata]|uniref:Hexosyltransferase n=1 Tax=Pinctada imbricata TaxID=66713 RepID=A0AA89C4Q4_PINIB|nr:hypothetical protein FSP39_002118 [Pinctada imbricata]
MNKISLRESTTQDVITIADPQSEVYFDNYKEWFQSKNVTLYETKDKHPKLPKISIKNSEICKNTKNVDILIYIQSHWENIGKRSLLRETWANRNVFRDISVRIIFILGKPSKSSDQMKVKNENLAHHDIIQGDFIDSFKNITLKSILALHWINEHCLNSRYILKTDDDIFINIFALLEYMISEIYSKNKVVMCQLKQNGTSPIMRDPKNKWYIPEEVFPGKTHFPQFCSGYTVLFTSDLIPDLYKTSFTAPYFSVDDVYVFGYLLPQIKSVQYEDVSNALTLNTKSGLQEYEGNGPLVHVAVGAAEKGAMEKLWTRTLQKLSDWAKRHAKIVDVKNKQLVT